MGRWDFSKLYKLEEESPQRFVTLYLDIPVGIVKDLTHVFGDLDLLTDLTFLTECVDNVNNVEQRFLYKDDFCYFNGFRRSSTVFSG